MVLDAPAAGNTTVKVLATEDTEEKVTTANALLLREALYIKAVTTPVRVELGHDGFVLHVKYAVVPLMLTVKPDSACPPGVYPAPETSLLDV
jgi:hypothetical protein